MKHNSDNVRLFMDQEPSFQVAKFVYECMEFRRSEECEDCNPYFDLSLFICHYFFHPNVGRSVPCAVTNSLFDPLVPLEPKLALVGGAAPTGAPL